MSDVHHHHGRVHQFAGPSFDPDLMHWWKFDNDLKDTVGDLDLTAQFGPPTYAAGVFNTGTEIDFDKRIFAKGGVSDTEIYGGKDGWTHTGWAKNNIDSDYWTTWYPVPTPLTTSAAIVYNVASQNKCEFYIQGQAGTKMRATGALIGAGMAGKWTFVACLWDEVAEESLFYRGLNGAALISTAGNKVGWTGPRLKPAVGEVRIASGTLVTGHMLDDIRIYSKLLSLEEINAIYDEGKAALGL